MNLLLRRQLKPALAAIAVGVFFGGSLLWNILPGGQSNVSWDGHLFGLLAGLAVAYLTKRPDKYRAD